MKKNIYIYFYIDMIIFILKKNNLRYWVVDLMSDLFIINLVFLNCYYKKNVIILYIYY